jgi:hypothetical protein
VKKLINPSGSAQNRREEMSDIHNSYFALIQCKNGRWYDDLFTACRLLGAITLSIALSGTKSIESA